VIVDHTNRRVLDVLESREKVAVVKFLRESQASGLLAHVTEVTSDMWDGYVEAAREVFGPSVTLTIDRFHVMKNLQDRLTAARREIQRELPEHEARELKGSRWLWLTNPENLEEDQLQRLTELKSQFPRLAQLADQREALRQLFEDRSLTTATAGSLRLTEWLTTARALGLSALNKFCDTLHRWQDKIANYFVSRSSNGPTEGFNNGLRTILRRTFGMHNFHHFRLRVLDRFGTPQPPEST
jgi:transposase